MSRPKICCMLPARNATQELDGWFHSVEQFADVVVALDDGSTDDTAELLTAHPLVQVLLSNPRRPDYRGWDDAANRNRLLEAAAGLEPMWVFSLDADERLDAGDAAALREFVDDADPTMGYLCRVFRMVGTDVWDDDHLWVGRLFAYREGIRFPDARLHFVPLPADIPRDRWAYTTFRIQHFGSESRERRQHRYAKYLEADPEREFQASYENLLKEPAAEQPWVSRPPCLPALMHRSGSTSVAGNELALSAVVIAQNDAERIETCIEALLSQECDEPFEVIVVDSGEDHTAEIVRSRFPDVTLVKLPQRALPGGARNAGLAVARGEFVTFPGSHVRAAPGFLQARLRGHRLGFCMVTGPFAAGVDTRSGWASYFLDHSSQLPGRPSGRLTGFPPSSSYRRDALEWLGGFPDIRAGEDTSVNRALWDAGYGAYYAADGVLVHDTPCSSPLRLVRHQLVRGRGFARVLAEDHARSRLLTRTGLRNQVLVYVPGRIRRIRSAVRQQGSPAEQRQLRRALPLVAVGAITHWVSGWVRLPAELRRGRAKG